MPERPKYERINDEEQGIKLDDMTPKVAYLDGDNVVTEPPVEEDKMPATADPRTAASTYPPQDHRIAGSSTSAYPQDPRTAGYPLASPRLTDPRSPASVSPAAQDPRFGGSSSSPYLQNQRTGYALQDPYVSNPRRTDSPISPYAGHNENAYHDDAYHDAYTPPPPVLPAPMGRSSPRRDYSPQNPARPTYRNDHAGYPYPNDSYNSQSTAYNSKSGGAYNSQSADYRGDYDESHDTQYYENSRTGYGGGRWGYES